MFLGTSSHTSAPCCPVLIQGRVFTGAVAGVLE